MIVLDTHAWVWWLSDPQRVPGPARDLIEGEVEAGESLVVSSISVWEVAMLVARGRLDLTLELDEWVALAESIPSFTFVPVDNRIALRAVRLEDVLHKDPADRLIVATAQGLGAALVTGDRRLREFDGVETAWD